MSHTFLDAVNETLKRVGVIDSYNTGLLTTFSQSAQQREIDIAIQVINEGIDELARTNKQLPLTMAEGTLTLVTNQREYTLATDFITMTFPMIDRVNTQYVWEWQGNYNELLLWDPQQVFTGLPEYGMISPETGKFRLDRAPDSTLNGRNYYYEYKRNLVLVNTTDPIPFNDAAFRAMVPAWAQLYSRERKKEFDQGLYQQGMARAAYEIREVPIRDSYSPRGRADAKDQMPW